MKHSLVHQLLFVILVYLTSSCAGSDVLCHAGEMLLGNLAKFHNGLPNDIEDNILVPQTIGLGVEAVDSFESEPDRVPLVNGSIASIPDFVNMQMLTYLDSNSFVSLMKTSKYSHKITNYSIKKKLNEFSPYLVFKESWMNRIMFSFVSVSFADIATIDDPRIYDILELLNIKWLRHEEVHSSLSPDMIYMLLCFFQEMINGPDATISKFFVYSNTMEHVMPIILHDHFE